MKWNATESYIGKGKKKGEGLVNRLSIKMPQFLGFSSQLVLDYN
tara:strand:+ start:647 stop:778 length:132 start_codon:yes stop_codon:yes gene_type:complete